jgi:hypothetical protein
MTREPFQYAVIRVVPSLPRHEFVNVGMIVFCRTRGFLAARIALDERRLEALAPSLEVAAVAAVAEHLQALVDVAAGEPAAGPIAALPQSERFHWLVAPSSTTVQTSPVHSGLCEDPVQTLDQLFAALVLPPSSAA